nr:Cas9 endonuclease PAM-interacting domain-containing protein [Fructilactobacillus fructivorans]
MLYKFEKNHQLDGDGEIKNDNDNMLRYMKRVYHFKKMLITKELETNHGALYKQTVFPSPAHGKSRKLINAKKDRPTDIYGGYSAQTNGFMALVKIAKPHGDEYRLYGIPLMEYNQLKDNEAGKFDKHAIDKIIDEQLTNKKGKMPEHRVVLYKVDINQLVKDDHTIYTVSSKAYKQSAQQLVLSDGSMRTLTNNYKNVGRDDLIETFNEIIDNTIKFMNMYDINDPEKIKSNFTKLSDNQEMRNVINNLLISLHANAARGDVSGIGMSKWFGLFQLKAGLKLSLKDELIYQSPTGLFSRKVRISDL